MSEKVVGVLPWREYKLLSHEEKKAYMDGMLNNVYGNASEYVRDIAIPEGKGGRSLWAEFYCEWHGKWDGRKDTVEIGRSCRKCKTSKTAVAAVKKSYVYVLKVVGYSMFTGYGITSSLKERHSRHQDELRKAGCEISEFRSFTVPGQGNQFIERGLKHEFPLFSQPIVGFRTEATDYEYFEQVLEFVEDSILQRKRLAEVMLS